MSSTQTLEKIDKLLQKFQDPSFPEDLETIREWRNKVNMAILKKDLLQHEAVKMIIDYAKEEMEDIIFLLQTTDSQKLPDDLRDKLLYRKSMWRWFVGIFKNPDEEIKEIEAKVDEEEKNLES